MVETSVEKGNLFNSYKTLVLGIVSLVLIIAVFSLLNRDQTGLKEGTVVIKAGDSAVGSLTIADLQKLTVVEKKMTIHSTRGNTRNDFTCTPLLAVLNSIDPTLTKKYKKIVTRGIDNYTGVEAMFSNNIMFVPYWQLQ